MLSSALFEIFQCPREISITIQHWLDVEIRSNWVFTADSLTQVPLTQTPSFCRHLIWITLCTTDSTLGKWIWINALCCQRPAGLTPEWHSVLNSPLRTALKALELFNAEIFQWVETSAWHKQKHALEATQHHEQDKTNGWQWQPLLQPFTACIQLYKTSRYARAQGDFSLENVHWEWVSLTVWH